MFDLKKNKQKTETIFCYAVDTINYKQHPWCGYYRKQTNLEEGIM